MKRITPLLLIFLIMFGCSTNMQPKWYYDLKKDGLYRTDQNTKTETKINSQDYASDILITDAWIYYNYDNKLYRMNNYNGREQLESNVCICLGLNGDRLYYLKNSRICKMKLDGSEKTQLLDSNVNWMVVTDKYIFYALKVPIDTKKYSDDGPRLPLGELHRVDLNGKDDVNLKVLVTEFLVYNNSVYYTDDKDNYLYSMNPETLSKSIAHKGYFIEDIYISDGFAFFILDRNLVKMSIAEGTITNLTNGYWWHCRGILDGYVYISSNLPEVEGMWKIKIGGVNLEKVE